MKKIRTIILSTMERKIRPIDEVFFHNLGIEINDCKNKIKNYPDIGVVKDGSTFAMQKILESIQKKANRMSDKNMIFTTFYEDIVDDIKAINEILDNNKDKEDARNVLVGQRSGYIIAKNLIKELNDAKEVME